MDSWIKIPNWELHCSACRQPIQVGEETTSIGVWDYHIQCKPQPRIVIFTIEVEYAYGDLVDAVLHLEPHEDVDMNDPLQVNALQRVFLEDLRQQLEAGTFEASDVEVKVGSPEEESSDEDNYH